jgi:hypothetical protein
VESHGYKAAPILKPQLGYYGGDMVGISEVEKMRARFLSILLKHKVWDEDGAVKIV